MESYDFSGPRAGEFVETVEEEERVTVDVCGGGGGGDAGGQFGLFLDAAAQTALVGVVAARHQMHQLPPTCNDNSNFFF